MTKICFIKHSEFTRNGIRYTGFLVNPKVLAWAEKSMLIDNTRTHRLISGLFIDLTDEETTMLYLKWGNRV